MLLENIQGEVGVDDDGLSHAGGELFCVIDEVPVKFHERSGSFCGQEFVGEVAVE